MNDALYRDEGAEFYQYIERNFHDEVSFPWQGGQYGFVRDPVDSPLGTIFTRFHEGLDIKPLQRDARGEPLDDVMAAADGRAVHVSPLAGASNYGKYVVIEHVFGGSPYYSLYAHLSEIVVTEGASVKQGQKIARMGHTGAGIDRPRSHLHFELNMMLNSTFDRWSQAVDPSDPNQHGLFNGQNLAGLDAAKLYLALKKDPTLTIPRFLAREEIFFKALMPAGPQPPDLLRLYPWMGPAALKTALVRPAAWEIAFTRAGLPLSMTPSTTAVSAPTLSFVQAASVPYWELSHRLLSGAGPLATLSGSGQRLLTLIGHSEPPENAVAGQQVSPPPRPVNPPLNAPSVRAR
jgi:murein DD-endopeptidase MepM/ murein hydrolase activator NlpD